jgi:hypothetical protein
MITWIKVSEKLPDTWRTVLCFNDQLNPEEFIPNEALFLGYYSVEEKYFCLSGKNSNSVTHWAELSQINLPEKE